MPDGYLCLECGETDPEKFQLVFDKRRGKAYPEKSRCRKCRNKVRSPKSFEQRKNAHLKGTYGITLEQYFHRLLVLQEGRCLVCRKHYLEDTQWENRMWPVDHDHATGAVRGILCKACNTTIGLVQEDPETMRNMISYLERA